MLFLSPPELLLLKLSLLNSSSSNLKLSLDLHEQPLANSFKKNIDEKQEEFPLAVNHCKDCFHVQLTHAVNPDLMFKDYLYVSGTSQTMNDHFEWFARYSKEYFETLSKEFLDSVRLNNVLCYLLM